MNDELIMQDILNSIRKHQDSFIKNSGIKQLYTKLGIEHQYDETDINEIYGKVQENSSLVFVYDIDKKKFHQNLVERKFLAKCYSYYSHAEKTIYVSGGMSDFNKNKKYSNSFFSIKIKNSL